MGARQYLDILERVAWTAIQAFLAAWIVLGDFSQETLKISGAAALVAAAKCLLAVNVGRSDSGAAIPGVRGHEPAPEG